MPFYIASVLRGWLYIYIWQGIYIYIYGRVLYIYIYIYIGQGIYMAGYIYLSCNESDL